MKSKAYIITTGVISAIGQNTAANYESLINEHDGIDYASILETHWKATFPVAEVKMSNVQLAEKIAAPASWPRTALLSGIAVQECLQAFPEIIKQTSVGFFSGNTVGGMDKTEQVYATIKTDATQTAKENFIHHECGAITNLVAQHFQLNGFTTTISTACSSSANTIMMAAQMIENGMLDAAIAGGADSLSKFTLNGFNTLMIVDKQKCQPFDNNRRGLNLGEGAGYLLIVSETMLQQLNATPIAVVSGYANANDAFHQTASSPEGKGNTLAMQQALNIASLPPQAISYINAHGTGTPNNDSAEATAIQNVFGENVPPYSSTKCFTGHTLGASGGIEAVYSILALQHGTIFPTMRLETPMEDVNIKPETTLIDDASIHHVMSNSFGFGGNCSSLIFSKC